MTLILDKQKVLDKQTVLEKCIRLDPCLPKETNGPLQKKGEMIGQCVIERNVPTPQRTQLSMINALAIESKIYAMIKERKEKRDKTVPLLQRNSGRNLLYNCERSDDEMKQVGRTSSVAEFIANAYFPKQGMEIKKAIPQNEQIELSWRPSKILLELPCPCPCPCPCPKGVTKQKPTAPNVLVTANFFSVSFLRARKYKSRQDVTSTHHLQLRPHQAIDIRNVINVGEVMSQFSLKKGIFIPHTNANKFHGNSAPCGRVNKGCMRRISFEPIISQLLDRTYSSERKCLESFVTKRHPNLSLQCQTSVSKKRNTRQVDAFITSKAISELVEITVIGNTSSTSSNLKAIQADTFSILQSLESFQKMSVTNRGELLHLATKADEIKKFGIRNVSLKPSTQNTEESLSIKLPLPQHEICFDSEGNNSQKDKSVSYDKKDKTSNLINVNYSDSSKKKRRKKKRKRRHKKDGDISHMKRTKRRHKLVEQIENQRGHTIEVPRIAVPTIHVGFTPMVVEHESYEVTSLRTDKEGSSCKSHVLNKKKSTTSIKLVTTSCEMNNPTKSTIVSKGALEEQNQNLTIEKKQQVDGQDTKDETRVKRSYKLNASKTWCETSSKKVRPIRDLSEISAKTTSRKEFPIAIADTCNRTNFSDCTVPHINDHDVEGNPNLNLHLSLGRNLKSAKIGKKKLDHALDNSMAGNVFQTCTSRKEKEKAYEDQLQKKSQRDYIESQSSFRDDVLPENNILFSTKGRGKDNVPFNQNKCHRVSDENMNEREFSSTESVSQFNVNKHPVNTFDILPSESVPNEHNSVQGIDGFSLLCSENFIEELSMTATELSSGHWCDSIAVSPNDDISKVSMTKVILRDCALVDEGGIDIEVSIKTAIKIIKMSSWTSRDSGKESTRNLVSVVSCGRYDMLFVLLVVDVSDPTHCLKDIVSLQNATVKQNGCPCDQIRFQYVSPSLLSFFIMNIVKQHYDFSNKTCQWIGENILDEHQIEIVQFLLSIVPTMTVLDAIGLITFDLQSNRSVLMKILNPLFIRQIESKDKTETIIKKRSIRQLGIALQVPIGKLPM